MEWPGTPMAAASRNGRKSMGDRGEYGPEISGVAGWKGPLLILGRDGPSPCNICN